MRRDENDLHRSGELSADPFDGLDALPLEEQLPPPAMQPSTSPALGRFQAVPGEWWADKPARREYLLTDGVDNGGHPRGWLPKGIVALLAAAGGTGKSHALCGLALAVATGRPWLGAYTVAGGPGRVALLLGEETAEEVRRRLYLAARAMGWRAKQGRPGLFDDAGEPLDTGDRMWTLPGAGLSTLALTRAEEGGLGAETSWAGELRGWLQAEAERRGPWAAILVDPLSRFAGPDVEKDAAAATRLVQVLESFAALRGSPCVLVAHHTRKPGKDERGGEASAADVRGSSALVDGCRWVARLESETLPEGRTFDGVYGFARLTVVKTNYTLQGEPRLLARREGGALSVATDAEEQAIQAAKRTASAPKKAEKDPGLRREA